MTTSSVRNRVRRRKSSQSLVLRPAGKIDQQVQEVGPEHFGIVSIDCAKARSKLMLCDFFGNVLVPPTEVEHQASDLNNVIDSIRQAIVAADIRKSIVAIERTGNYHLPTQRAFRAAGFTTRVVHPYASRQYRQPASPGVKTDDKDLAGIHRAAMAGFALLQQALPPDAIRLQLLVRHRRDLVRKSSALCCQTREHLHQMMPGYAELFEERLWTSTLAMPIAIRFHSAQAVLNAGLEGLESFLREAEINFQRKSLFQIVGWAKIATPPDPDAELRFTMLESLYGDLCQKKREISLLEVGSAELLAATPYLLLMAIPGINVITAAELAGEMGPITDYANANAITGRAGLFPGRYQSDQTDQQRMPLVRCANKRLRNAVMQIAENLICCNDFFRTLAASWKLQKLPTRRQRVKVARRFSRIAFSMVAGQQVFPHACCREPDYMLNKLLTFILERKAELETIERTLLAATRQIPGSRRKAEADSMSQNAQQAARKRGGTRKLPELLNLVVARLIGQPLQLRTEDAASN